MIFYFLTYKHPIPRSVTSKMSPWLQWSLISNEEMPHFPILTHLPPTPPHTFHPTSLPESTPHSPVPNTSWGWAGKGREPQKKWPYDERICFSRSHPVAHGTLLDNCVPRSSNRLCDRSSSTMLPLIYFFKTNCKTVVFIPVKFSLLPLYIQTCCDLQYRACPLAHSLPWQLWFISSSDNTLLNQVTDKEGIKGS